MRQLVQSVKNGNLQVLEFPTPQPGPTEVLVATRRSLISSGTETAVRNLASANLLQKAKARPDLVRQVLDKAKSDGFSATLNAVRTKLDDDMPLGYSAMGIAIAVGEAVAGIRPGDRVATASAGHGDYQLVPGLLCAKVPDEVDDSSAAFATVGAIALHGLRQANVGVDETIAVIGLGLLGQLTVRLALASGLRVIGIDVQPLLVERAALGGATAMIEAGSNTARSILDLTSGIGVDAVLITAATQSSAPVSRATEILRDRGKIVIVGDVGLELDRRPFYEKEIDIRFARSYGPGRHDRSYEEYAVDYPIGHVRWTEGRNLQAVLSLIGRGRLVVSDLVSASYTLDQAELAYAALKSSDPVLGLQFEYDSPSENQINKRISIDPSISSTPVTDRHGNLNSGVIGAGQFAKATLLPAMQTSGWPTPIAITSASGLSARSLAEKYRIGTISPNAQTLIEDPNVSAVFILSRHDSHADLTEAALLAGKDVFVEKPLALTENELERITRAQQESERILWAGFNRRYATAVTKTMEVLGSAGGPLVANYRVNAGSLPESHWYKDRRQGGRLLGEACHFVDTVSWIIGSQPSKVAAFGDGRGESLLQEDFTIALQYPCGSTASISYATGGCPRTQKERLEILGRGHTIVIDDYKSVSINGKDETIKPADKGHRENLSQFASAIKGSSCPAKSMAASFGTTNIMIEAARSITSAQIIEHNA